MLKQISKLKTPITGNDVIENILIKLHSLKVERLSSLGAKVPSYSDQDLFHLSFDEAYEKFMNNPRIFIRVVDKVTTAELVILKITNDKKFNSQIIRILHVFSGDNERRILLGKISSRYSLINLRSLLSDIEYMEQQQESQQALIQISSLHNDTSWPVARIMRNNK